MKIFDKLDERYTKISLYVIGTFVCVMVIYQIINNVVPVVNWVFSVVHVIFDILTPVLIGFVLAYLLNPVIKYFEKQLSKVTFFQKKAHLLGVLCTILLVLLALLGIVSLLASTVTEQIRLANFDDLVLLITNTIDSLNELYQDVMKKLNGLNFLSDGILPHIEDIAQQVLTNVQDWLSNLLSSVTNISGYFVNILVSLIISIYLMMDGDRVANLLKRIANVIFSKRANAKTHELLQDLDISFSGYIRGTLADVVVMMVVISVALTIIGVRFGILIGILAGIFNIIPFMGPIIAYAFTTVICVINGDYKVLVIALIALSIIQILDGNVIAPKLMSRSIKTHPLLVMIFLLVGSTVGGFLGMLLAVPIGGFVKLVFMKWLKKQENRKATENESG